MICFGVAILIWGLINFGDHFFYTIKDTYQNTRLNISPIGHKDIGVFSSYNMIFYFHFEGRDFLYCPTKTILSPPMIISCKNITFVFHTCSGRFGSYLQSACSYEKWEIPLFRKHERITGTGKRKGCSRFFQNQI